jgi:hypothetical protein
MWNPYFARIPYFPRIPIRQQSLFCKDSLFSNSLFSIRKDFSNFGSIGSPNFYKETNLKGKEFSIFKDTKLVALGSNKERQF